MAFHTTYSTKFLTNTTFLTNAIPLRWADILWGYRQRIIGWRVPIELAMAKGSPMDEDSLVSELAGLSKDQDWRVGEILESLASQEPVDEKVSKRKWLYITLVWLYQNRTDIDNIYDKLNDTCDDFGSPEETWPLISYMPPDDGYDPRKHTREENRARMLRKWKEYLESTRIALS